MPCRSSDLSEADETGSRAAQLRIEPRVRAIIVATAGARL
jgi:hypothetical protein